MESLLVYLVLATAIVLMLAGVYGAAPALFVRRQTHAGARDAAGHLLALGGAFPLLEQDLSSTLDGPFGRPPAVSALLATESLLEEALSVALKDDADSQTSGAAQKVDEELLSDLFAEIGMLRAQLEGLRVELVSLVAQTAAITGIAPPAGRAAPTATASEARRRNRTAAKALTVSLQDRVGAARRQRRA